MSTKAALLAALLFTAAVPAPALAAQAAPAAAPAAAPSKEARPALAALQKAANENRVAELPALSQAALAVAKTPIDRYFAYQLQLKPLAAANNDAALLAALEGTIATGVPKGPELANYNLVAARLYFNKGSADTAATAKAAAAVEQVVASDPNNVEGLYILGLVRNRQKRPAEAVTALQKSIQLSQASGKPADPQIFEQALSIAYNNRLPVARELAFTQLKTAPTPKNWRTALKIYEQTSNLNAADKIDLFRLQRLTNSFEGEGDYFPYVDALLTRGLPGEAKAVLDEAFAANKIDRNKATWKEMASSAGGRIAGDRASLASGEKTALAASTARPALNTGDAFLSYGDYAKAATLYRAALGKGGADADLANLRLGIALTRSGDTAGATAAFNAVKGNRASLAQMWLLYLQTKA
ncbi:hypothetical protein GCM10022280_14180 [Sphingomonas swuensis]|uniref:Tetratricopeptide repeat protein n=1 Tax=Sphingomonas swuensis TaxID=977800 RepID=A0ABP7STJ8_9SPHN